MHDYMHGLCQNGVLNWVFFLWIQPLASSGVAEIWKAHGFVQLWAQPAIHKCNLQRLFLPKAVEGHKKAGKFRCILRGSGSVPGAGTLCPNLLLA